MTYVVTEACIRCKYMDCVSVCPVNCFHEGANMLVIHPDGCIDCGVCEPACPASAIIADTAPGASRWRAMNAEMASIWPAIHKNGEPPADADAWKGVSGKYDLYFSRDPGDQGRDQDKS